MRKPRANTPVALLLNPAKWRSGRGQSNGSDRWTNWAHALRSRHSRIALRYHALTLILARTQANSYSQIERWQHMSLKLFPTIRLSIGPNLLGFGDPATRPHLAMPVVTTEREPGGVVKEFIYTGPQRSQQLPLKQQQPSATGADSLFKKSGTEHQNSLFQSPLMRLFERQAKPALELKRFEAGLGQRGLQLVNRVLAGRRRLEEDVRRNFVNREQRAAPIADKHVNTDNTVFESARGMRSGTAGPTDASGWPIDIERLTEQVVRNIDSRIIAHRERTGRVF